MAECLICDIGINYILTAVGGGGRDELKLTHETARRYERPLFEGGRLVHPDALVRLLVEAPGARRGMSTVFVLSDALQATREARIPAGADKHARSIVELAAAEYLAGDISDYTIDYRILPGGTALSAALHTSLGAALHMAARDAGLRLKRIDVPLSCLARYILRLQNSGAASGLTILADFSDAGTAILAALDGRMVRMAAIPNGGLRNLTTDVARAVGVPVARATELLLTVDINNDGGAEEYERTVRVLRDHMNAVGRTMQSELKALLPFIESASAHMYLSGILTRIQGIPEYVGEMFAVYGVGASLAPHAQGLRTQEEDQDVSASFMRLAGALL